MRMRNVNEKLMFILGSSFIGVISLVITLSVYKVGISKPSKSNENKQIVSEVKLVSNDDLSDQQKLVVKNIITKLDELKENEEASINSESKEIINNQENNIQIAENSVVDELEEEEVIETFLNLKKAEIEFIKPIEGEIGLDYVADKLVYSKTLDEWIIHDGVDFKAPVGTEVYAIADGVILDAYEDTKYGYTITIKHDEGYISKYCSIEKNDNLNVGDEIKKHDIVSKVAKSYGFEADEESHLHFELLKDGEKINPKFN